jgi:hypothetical protein
MEFVNEYLTQEKMEEFEKKEMTNSGNKLAILTPYRWTVNQEENMFLIKGLEEREEPHNQYFLFHWYGRNLKAKFEPLFIDGSTLTCMWRLIYIETPEEILDKKVELFDDLKRALQVYAINGNPSDQCNKIYKVEFNF